MKDNPDPLSNFPSESGIHLNLSMISTEPNGSPLISQWLVLLRILIYLYVFCRFYAHHIYFFKDHKEKSHLVYLDAIEISNNKETMPKYKPLATFSSYPNQSTTSRVLLLLLLFLILVAFSIISISYFTFFYWTFQLRIL